jgi:hypothetical protein
MITLKIHQLESAPSDLSLHSPIPKTKQPSSCPSPSADYQQQLTMMSTTFSSIGHCGNNH